MESKYQLGRIVLRDTSETLNVRSASGVMQQTIGKRSYALEIADLNEQEVMTIFRCCADAVPEFARYLEKVGLSESSEAFKDRMAEKTAVLAREKQERIKRRETREAFNKDPRVIWLRGKLKEVIAQCGKATAVELVKAYAPPNSAPRLQDVKEENYRPLMDACQLVLDNTRKEREQRWLSGDWEPAAEAAYGDVDPSLLQRRSGEWTEADEKREFQIDMDWALREEQRYANQVKEKGILEAAKEETPAYRELDL